MGLLDDAKKFADTAAQKAEAVATEHGDKVEGAIDKAAGFVDDKTGGKHSDKVQSAASLAKDTVKNLSQRPSGEGDKPAGS